MGDNWITQSTELTAARSLSATTKSAEEEGGALSEKEIEEWLMSNGTDMNKFFCLFVGKDGSGKSPLAISFLTDEDIKEGKKVVILDLDGGNVPLLNKYQADRCQKLGQKVSDIFIVKNPLEEKIDEKGISHDYKTTFGRIRGVIRLLKNKEFVSKNKIKYIILDGLTTLLKFSEYQMRLDKHIAADGGVDLRFWMLRNKMFIEMLESLKSLPMSCFLIAHEDFILKEDEKNSSVKEKVNAMVHQKILAVKEEKPDKNGVIFKAKILKSKYNIMKEGEEIIFGDVDLKNKKYTFEPEKILVGLI